METVTNQETEFQKYSPALHFKLALKIFRKDT